MRLWFQTDPEVGMLDVVVDPDHQGRGIGTSLAARAEQHLLEHGLRTVRSSSLDAPGATAVRDRARVRRDQRQQHVVGRPAHRRTGTGA